MDAVTAGTIKIVHTADGTPMIILSGADGATYTYKNVTPTAKASAAKHSTVRAGAEIASSDPGGLTFTISVPDVRGAVDADEALQAWSSGIAVNVRALPPAVGAASQAAAAATEAAVTGKDPRPHQRVLVMTDQGARTVGRDLAASLRGPLVSAQTEMVPGTRPVRGHELQDRVVTRSGNGQLMIVVLAKGTPAQAAALARHVAHGSEVLWVAPAGTTPRQAAAYRAIVDAYPGFRVESLPAALATASRQASGQAAPAAKTAGTGLSSPVEALATATLTASYATTAYRLDTVSPEADTVLSWAEEQLGKPYKWAGAGPDSFDCSGLTMDALAQAGIALPHNANAQWQQTRQGAVAENKLAPGDLVFFTGADGTSTAPGHVGIYVGDGEIIDAPYQGAKVRFDRVADVGGYTGATNPYSPVPATGTSAAGGGVPLPTAGSTVVPAELSQYQSFAQGLVDSVWNSGQFPFLYMLWVRESGWNPAAINPVSGAFGIPQALPAVKMATAGLDWATDPYTQIIWGIDYIRAAYGTPQAAWAHELAYNWY